MIRRLLQAILAATVATAPGRAAAGEDWTLFLDFTFVAESQLIGDADRAKARRVAEYMERNPTYRIGLDGLSRGRVSSVRDALLDAGVAESRIHVGAFGAPRLRGERRVLVMIGR